MAATPRIAARALRKPMDRDRIEKAALKLIERKGLAACSQRALAKQLGIEAMSLYHWYPSRADLLNALLDRWVAELVVPTHGGLISRLRAAAHSFRARALRYPQFVGGFVLMHRFNTEASLEVLEKLLQVFYDAGIGDERAARLFRMWMQFLMGALLDETSGYSRGPSATRPLPDDVLRERFPLVDMLGPYNKPEHHDANFAFGLEAVLGALARAC